MNDTVGYIYILKNPSFPDMALEIAASPSSARLPNSCPAQKMALRLNLTPDFVVFIANFPMVLFPFFD